MIDSDTHNVRALFKQISAGNEQAFRTIFELYKVELFLVVIRLTKSQIIAQEIIQEVFISLWVSRKHLSKVEEPASYIYRILFNKTGNYLKKEANQKTIIKAALQYMKSSSDATEQTVNINETERLIELALRQLPTQQKIVYKLSRQQGLSNNEIACQLNVSQHTVKSHLSKAIGFIRTYLEDVAMGFVLLAILNSFIL